MPGFSQLFNRPDTHPVVLDVALFQAFGLDWISWDPDSIFTSIQSKYGTSPSRQSKSRIYALSVLHSNHAYWEDWRAFEAMSWSLSGKQVDLVQLNPLMPSPLVYAYRVVKWIDDKPKFSDDVEAYMTSVFLHEQYSLLPTDISFLQDRLFKTRPDLRDRADLVKSAILSEASNYDMEDTSEDPVKVELARHHVLTALMNIVCSEPFVMAQARRYGLDSMVSQVFKGAN